MNGRLWGLALAFAIAPNWVAAEVVDSAANGFTVKETVVIKATPQEVYARILRVDWWDPVHTYSHDVRNLSIEAKAGGCYCEKMPDGGSVKHMEVVFVSPGKTLGMRGALGPMQAMAVTGSMRIELSVAEGGTKVETTYAAGGYSAAGLNTLGAVVDRVLNEQFTRLKNAIEKGSPDSK